MTPTGLYLKQMGSIPLLSRDLELDLAIRLENARRRYRRAALFNWVVLRKVYAKFQEIKAGQVPLDPHIDVVNSVGLTREEDQWRRCPARAASGQGSYCNMPAAISP